MHDRQDSEAADGDGVPIAPREGPARIVVFPRVGRPPLRIRAECVCCVGRSGEDGEARLEIWQRPSGGAVAWLALAPDTPAETVTAESLDALLSALECRVGARPGRRADRPPGSRSAPKAGNAARAIERLAVRLADEQSRHVLSDLIDRALGMPGMAGRTALPDQLALAGEGARPGPRRSRRRP
jgi:hypothetical protein